MDGVTFVHALRPRHMTQQNSPWCPDVCRLTDYHVEASPNNECRARVDMHLSRCDTPMFCICKIFNYVISWSVIRDKILGFEVMRVLPLKPQRSDRVRYKHPVVTTPTWSKPVFSLRQEDDPKYACCASKSQVKILATEMRQIPALPREQVV